MGNIVTVNFRNDTLFAVERDDGVFLALKPICDSLGVAWQGQLQRVKDDPVLGEGVTTIVIPSVGGPQETVCLKMEMVNGWLFKIDSRRVKDEEAKQKLLTYQRECYGVLHQHFYGKTAPKPVHTGDEDAQENESTKVRLVTESRQTFGTQAAGQLWFKLGLPMVPAMLQDPLQMSLLDYSVIKTAAGEAA
jgi:hypothetical protein